MAVSFVTMSLGARAESAVVIAIALAAGGWAFGHVQPGIMASIGNAVEEHHFGSATSLQQTANQVGAVVGMGLFTAVATDASEPGPFVVVYLLAALSAPLCGATAFWLPDDDRALSPLAVTDDGTEHAMQEQLVHRKVRT